MSATHARLCSTSARMEANKGLVARLNRAAAAPFRPAVVPVGSTERHRPVPVRESVFRHARAAEALRCEDNRMRLVAGLLILATLLLWILFLQA